MKGQKYLLKWTPYSVAELHYHGSTYLVVKAVRFPQEADVFVQRAAKEVESISKRLDPDCCAGPGIQYDSCVWVHCAMDKV